jgi:hypothetical protein
MIVNVKIEIDDDEIDTTLDFEKQVTELLFIGSFDIVSVDAGE